MPAAGDKSCVLLGQIKLLADPFELHLLTLSGLQDELVASRRVTNGTFRIELNFVAFLAAPSGQAIDLLTNTRMLHGETLILEPLRLWVSAGVTLMTSYHVTSQVFRFISAITAIISDNVRPMALPPSNAVLANAAAPSRATFTLIASRSQ